jgi:uncharacterized protein
MSRKKFIQLEMLVLGLLRSELPPYISYHTAAHTERVINNVKRIARYEKISSKDCELIKIAALFHDTGFLIQPENHEEKSCNIARTILADFELASEDIETVCRMILATKIPQNPHTKLEEILADADLEYLGTADFTNISSKLFQELKHNNPALTLEIWNHIQIDFFEKHSYFTDYAKTYLTPKKIENLEQIKNK